MKSDPNWEISEQSVEKLIIIQVIEKHILYQKEDMYSFSSVYKQ